MSSAFILLTAGLSVSGWPPIGEPEGQSLLAGDTVHDPMGIGALVGPAQQRRSGVRDMAEVLPAGPSGRRVVVGPMRCRLVGGYSSSPFSGSRCSAGAHTNARDACTPAVRRQPHQVCALEAGREPPLEAWVSRHEQRPAPCGTGLYRRLPQRHGWITRPMAPRGTAARRPRRPGP